MYRVLLADDEGIMLESLKTVITSNFGKECELAFAKTGRAVVELAESYELCAHPIHPYAQTLLSAVPMADPVKTRSRHRILLEGDIPSPLNPPSGCRFHTRCPYATEKCSQQMPELKEYSPGHYAACHMLDKQ